MPRPQNVLAAAIFNAINAGYKKIELYGVDYSWTNDLWIDDNNSFCGADPHYYDKKQEFIKPSIMKRNDEESPLHEKLKSLAIAFESYYKQRKYADLRSVEIFTMTRGLFIDAFERGYKKWKI